MASENTVHDIAKITSIHLKGSEIPMCRTWQCQLHDCNQPDSNETDVHIACMYTHMVMVPVVVGIVMYIHIQIPCMNECNSESTHIDIQATVGGHCDIGSCIQKEETKALISV